LKTIQSKQYKIIKAQQYYSTVSGEKIQDKTVPVAQFNSQFATQYNQNNIGPMVLLANNTANPV